MNEPAKLAKDEPAFPVCYEHAEAGAEYHGMTLRDYFAAKAMQAIISAGMFNQTAEDMLKKTGVNVKETEAFYAMIAYGFADAMLAQRQKG